MIQNTLDIEQVRKYGIHTVVAGTIQLTELSSSFSIYIKVFFYTVEGVSR